MMGLFNCSIAICLIFLLWGSSANADEACDEWPQYVIPGQIVLMLTDEAAKLVDRANILDGGLLMGLASMDSLNASLGATSVRTVGQLRTFAAARRIYTIFFEDSSLTVGETCSLVSVYQDDLNVDFAGVDSILFVATAVAPITWATVKGRALVPRMTLGQKMKRDRK